MFCSVLKKENTNSSLNEIQQNLKGNTRKGDMLPIINTSNTHIRSFAKRPIMHTNIAGHQSWESI